MLSIRVFGEDITKPHHATLKPATTEEKPEEQGDAEVKDAEEVQTKEEDLTAPAEEDEEASLNV